MEQSSGGFRVVDWKEETYQEHEGGKLTRAHIVQEYDGGLHGTVPWDMLMGYRPDGTAVFVGLGRFDGDVDGKSGTVLFSATGAYDGTEARSTFDAVAGSGTGALRSLHASGSSAAGHGSTGTYTLEWQLNA
jgi:Protein of unknown function (DUF3224)